MNLESYMEKLKAEFDKEEELSPQTRKYINWTIDFTYLGEDTYKHIISERDN